MNQTLEQQFNSLDLQSISNFVESERLEDLQLDFKALKRSDFNSKDDRKLFAKCISGFANSAGGLIVWGVDARRNSDGVDCASAKAPIDKPKLFQSKLEEFTGSAGSPTIDGVLHKTIEEADGTGYVITHVPPQDGGPYMAKLGDDRYYKRSGGAFYRMEHFDISDMFGRRRQPSLKVTARSTIDHTRKQASIMLGLKNIGRGVARAPMLEIEQRPGLILSEYGVDGNCNDGMKRVLGTSALGKFTFAEGMDFVIHPGSELAVAVVRVPATDVDRVRGRVQIDFSVYAAGTSLRQGALIANVFEEGADEA